MNDSGRSKYSYISVILHIIRNAQLCITESARYSFRQIETTQNIIIDGRNVIIDENSGDENFSANFTMKRHDIEARKRKKEKQIILRITVAVGHILDFYLALDR